MKKLHVECLPDETLAKKLGFASRLITHHTGKSRVFHKLKSTTNELAMVDEDPNSSKTTYETNLQFQQESNGIKQYADNSGNKVLVLKGKLEDWILSICKAENIKPENFSLPNNPSQLHEVINQRLKSFERLLDALMQNPNSSIHELRKLLQS
jgi:hypothetical protein